MQLPAVIMPMLLGPPQLYYRNLLYTGITPRKRYGDISRDRTHCLYDGRDDRKTRRYSGLYYFMIGEAEHEKAEFEK